MKKYSDRVVYNIGRIYSLLYRYFSLIYSKYGLNPAKFNLMMVIKDKGKDKGVAQVDLSDELFVSAPNITKLIDSLEKQNFVKRFLSSDDRRVKLIKITPKGLKLLDTIWPFHLKGIEDIFLNFNEMEIKKLFELLEKLKLEIEKK